MNARTPSPRALSVWVLAIAAASSLFSLPSQAPAAERTSFRVAWSIYVGWMPWDYAGQSGILKKWADRYGIRIQLVQVNDYVESINQYTAGGFDACVMTNMDALTIPAAGGVESTALIAGDYSNGNDGVVLKGTGRTLADIRGQKVNLVALSVSHYLLARGLAGVGLRERDLTVVNTADADIVAAYSVPATTAVVAWKPQLAAILAAPGATLVFDSSRIPGEIVDLMVVNSTTLKANPQLGKALVGAWFETLGVMFGKGPQMLAARAAMAKASGTTPAGFDSQLATTHMFTSPADANAFMSGDTLPATMDLVRRFSFDHGLLGAGARTADAVGMDFPGGRSLGNPRNVKLHFDPTYVKLALDNGL